MGLYIKQNGAIKPLAGSTPGEGLPVGAITAFTANSIPSGWLLCDGSTFDETLYPALFLALGGNVLPDLRNRFLEGANSDTVQPASYTVNYIIKATSGITTEAALDAFNMIKEYERKQNILSDIETLNVTDNTNYTAEWDGYLTVNLTRSSDGTSKRIISVNGIPFTQGANVISNQPLGEVSTIILKKGDVWSIDYTSETNIYARWYKERDYEGR